MLPPHYRYLALHNITVGPAIKHAGVDPGGHAPRREIIASSHLPFSTYMHAAVIPSLILFVLSTAAPNPSRSAERNCTVCSRIWRGVIRLQRGKRGASGHAWTFLSLAAWFFSISFRTSSTATSPDISTSGLCSPTSPLPFKCSHRSPLSSSHVTEKMGSYLHYSVSKKCFRLFYYIFIKKYYDRYRMTILTPKP